MKNIFTLLSILVFGAGASAQSFTPDTVYEDMINHQYENCYILEDVNGYNQFYYNGSFSGNYPLDYVHELKTRVYSLARRNLCRTGDGPRVTPDQVYSDMVNFKYANCYILEDVNGYIQFYYEDKFSGNYASSQKHELKTRVLSLVKRNMCQKY